MWGVLFIWLVLVVVLALFLYRKYGSFTQRPWYVTVATLLGWSLSFLMVFLVPTDLSSSRYETCLKEEGSNSTIICHEPFNYIDSQGLKGIWELVYWSTFVLTWAVFPLMQAYSVSGAFTMLTRLKEAIRFNLLYYGVAVALALILAIIIIVKDGWDWSYLLGVFIALGNAFGLLIAIALMGVGLVEVPRALYGVSNRPVYTNLLYFRSISYRKSLENAQKRLDDVVFKIRQASFEVSRTDPLRPHMETILAKCEGHDSGLLTSRNSAAFGKMQEVTTDKLVELHAQLMLQKFMLTRAGVLYNHVVKRAIQYEDIEKSASSPEKVIQWTLKPKKRTHRFAEAHDKLEYYWRVHIEPVVLRTLCALFVICSLCLVWSEFIFPFDKNHRLSIPAAVVLGVSNHDATLQVLILIVLSYMAYATFAALFKLRLSNYYRLVNHNQSDSNSLLFSASYCCRLIAPLAYNFILMTALPTAFSEVMGQMGVGTIFSTYYPMIILVFFLGSLLRVFTRILVAFNIKRFQYDENFTDEQIVEGKALVARERTKRVREAGLQPQSHSHLLSHSSSDSALNAYRAAFESGKKIPLTRSEEQLNNRLSTPTPLGVGSLSRSQPTVSIQSDAETPMGESPASFANRFWGFWNRDSSSS